MFGLSNKIYEQIINVIKQYNYKFMLFGSRARGDYKENSDIDIAVLGKTNERDEYLIRNSFDLLDIPYTIDIIFVDKGIRKQLEASIRKEGVEL